MGLDIYLYYSNCRDMVDKLRDEYEKREIEINYEVFQNVKCCDATDEVIFKYRRRLQRLQEEMGLEDFGQIPEVFEMSICIDSNKYPNTENKIGYIHSAYNDFGFNDILYRTTGKNLHNIFSVHGYEINPDWKLCKERCQAVIDSYEEYLMNENGSYIITDDTHCLEELSIVMETIDYVLSK